MNAAEKGKSMGKRHDFFFSLGDFEFELFSTPLFKKKKKKLEI